MSPFIKGALAGLIVLPVVPAFAQDSAELPEITVQVQVPAAGDDKGTLSAPSVAQQKQVVNAVAGSVAFIDAKDYAKKYANNLVDVLQDTPGVFVQTRYSQEVRLSVRGSAISRGFHTRGVEILQDGIPFNLADGSGDYYQIDPLAIRSVGVYKGGNALLFGSSTLGGAFNFVSTTARTAEAQNIVRQEIGSFGTVRNQVQVSRVIGDWDFLINQSYTHADGWRARDGQKGEHFNANVGYRVSPNIETRFFFGAYYTDQLLPGSLTLTQALSTPKMASASATQFRTARNTHVERLANITTIGLETGRIDIATWAIHKNLDHPTGSSYIKQDGWTFGIAPTYTGKLKLGDYRDDLVVGARLYTGTNNARQFNYTSIPIGTQDLNAVQKAPNAELFVDNKFWATPTFALVSGVKLLAQSREFIDKGTTVANPTYRDVTRNFYGATPKVGVLWEPIKNVQVFANLTRSMDVPDFTDLGQGFVRSTNPAGVLSAPSKPFLAPIKTQKVWTGEIGTRGTYGRFGWDVTAYRSQLRDELLSFTTSPVIPVSTFNAPRTVHQGVEFAGNVDLARDLFGNVGDKLNLRQMWNYSDFRFRNDAIYGNNRIPGIPQHLLRTTLTYTHQSGFYVAPEFVWVPMGAFADYKNTQRVPGYSTYGIKSGIEFKNGVSVYVDARNLGNKRYVSDMSPMVQFTAASSAFYTGEGRAVYGGVKAKF